MNWRRALGSPLVALFSLGLLAAWPVVRAGYPSIGDGLNHLYRLVEFDHLLRGGVWFPRWATDLGYGYGYPLFNFYPPLVYYLGALAHALGLSFANSLLAVHVLSVTLAVTGAYCLAHEQWGEVGGLIAACAYGLAPYLYFDILARGALPETLALGLLPWALWAFVWLTRSPGAGPFLMATLLYGALILAHLLSALLAAPLLFLLAAVSIPPAPTPPPPQRLRHPIRNSQFLIRNSQFAIPNSQFLIRNSQFPILAFVIALLLTSFFLFPALLETRSVQIYQLTAPGDLDFHNNFLTFEQLFALPRTFDPRLVFIAVPPSLSLVALALACLGLVFIFIRNSQFATRNSQFATRNSQLATRNSQLATRNSQLATWEFAIAVFLFVYTLFTLPFTVSVWEKLPFASLLQFPWRLVGPASLLLALLAAASAPLLESAASLLGRRSGHGPSVVVHFLTRMLALSALFVYSLTWTFAPQFHVPASPSVRDLVVYEATGQLGTTSAGEFLPVDVHTLPAPDALSAQYAEKPIIDRLAPLPAGVTLISQSATLTSATAVVDARSPAVLTFNFFYFPGWSATVDGKPAPLRPSDPNGLLTVPIASGRHSLTVRFGSTPLRTTATVISVIALLVLAAITYRLRTHPPLKSPFPIRNSPFAIRHSPFPIPNSQFAIRNSPFAIRHSPFAIPNSQFPTRHLPFSLTALALLLLRLSLVDGRDSPFSRSRFNGAVVSGVGQTLDVNFGNQLALIGLDLPQITLAADQPLSLSLYWRAPAPPNADYATTVQVVDEYGNLFGQSDSQHPGRVPTSRWTPGQYAQDIHHLTLLPGTPPGAYRLMTGVYPFGRAALDVLDENQVPQGQTYTLGTLIVTRAARPPARINAAQPLDLSLGPLTLLGQSLNTRTPQVGDELRLTLFWRAEASSRSDLRLRLELTAPDGTLIQSVETGPARSDYPTSAWAPGEVVRAPLRFRIPASAPAGPATLQASLVSSGGAPQGGAPDGDEPSSTRVAGPSVIAALDLRVPDRSFSIPSISHLRGDVFGGKVKLLGYDLTPDGITLYWQALTPMDVSYTAFVHALDADDHILAQADAIPLNGARPTTGWLPGEVLADPYSLSLSRAVKIEIGLYDAGSRERLGTVIVQPVDYSSRRYGLRSAAG